MVERFEIGFKKWTVTREGQEADYVTVAVWLGHCGTGPLLLSLWMITQVSLVFEPFSQHRKSWELRGSICGLTFSDLHTCAALTIRILLGGLGLTDLTWPRQFLGWKSFNLICFSFLCLCCFENKTNIYCFAFAHNIVCMHVDIDFRKWRSFLITYKAIWCNIHVHICQNLEVLNVFYLTISA